MKIGVIGCGQVGSASAYACVLRGVGTELVLVDKNAALAVAQAEDIAHATPFAKAMIVRAGSYADLHDAAVVMIAAGTNQKPGETRLDLLKSNAEVFEAIVPQILAAAPGAILLIASNPVDIMTHMVARIAARHGSAPGRVLGSGTILDTARFRTLLAQHLNISSHSVHAHVLGEHGDSEVLHWSGANVGTVGLTDFAGQLSITMDAAIRARIDDGVRKAAYSIIQGKGATWYGIGAGMARITRAILEDEHAMLTCCAPQENFGDLGDVTLSLPHIVATKGIIRAVYPDLDTGEQAALRESARIIKDAISAVGYSS